MIINRLKITQLRAFDEAEFEFHPGMNLLVGINGVGKSTALDALRITFSQVMPKLSDSRSYAKSFRVEDIKVKSIELSVELKFTIGNVPISYKVMKELDKKAKNGILAPTLNIIRKSLKNDISVPLVIYFSPHRSVLTNSAPSNSRQSGIAAAYVDALTPRNLVLREFTAWLQTREVLAKEGSEAAQIQLHALNEAIKSFTDGCTGLVTEQKETLSIEKDGNKLRMGQLSDGERGVLALVLDLTRRLSQANPHLKNPAQEAGAIVLIDELDLHLHPRWQRTIVEKLTKIFPLCQFIATTHSPQIVGEVPPEQIYILPAHGEKPFKPDQSLGMDTNWILERLMETEARDTETENRLNIIANLIVAEEYEEAQEKIDALRNELGDFPELIRLQTRVDKFSILNEK